MLENASLDQLKTFIEDLAHEDKDEKVATKVEEVFSPNRKR